MSVWGRYGVCCVLLLAARAMLPTSGSSAQVSASVVMTPVGVAYDAAGNLYFSDVDRHEVFEATLAGALMIVAGNGVQGYGGDGGAALSAELNGPQGLAFGGDGTLYIADTGNNVVRAVSGGAIRTVAGNGSRGFGGDGGAATSAELSRPDALAVDASGALLICDSGNHRLRRAAGGMIATFAGSGVQGFGGDGGAAVAAMLDTPSGVAVAANGVVYVADTHNQRVRAVDANGVIATVAGTGIAGYAGDGGAATSALLDSPRGLAIGASSALLIADANNQRVRSVAGGLISTVAGGGLQGVAMDGAGATAAALNTPRGVGFGGVTGSVVIADSANHVLRVVTPSGALYVPAASTAGRTTTVALSVGTAAVVTVTGAVGTPQGEVQLMVDGVATAGVLSAGSASFSLSGMAAGSHTLQASYAGDGLNPAAVSSVATVPGAKAATAVVTQVPSQNSYAGLPLVLHAGVTSAASGGPTGTVNFMEGSSMVATAQIVAGTAAGVYLAPVAGTHLIAASYMGDANDLPSASPAVSVVIAAMPDFTIAAASSAQTVAAGSVASYGFSVSPQGGAFSGAVSLSVSGLPNGATASFAPPQVVPGSTGATAVLSVQTMALSTVASSHGEGVVALLLLPVMWFRRRLRCVVVSGVMMAAMLGCGERINETPSAAASSSTLTVTATGTNLAGVVVTHSTTVVLQVQ